MIVSIVSLVLYSAIIFVQGNTSNKYSANVWWITDITEGVDLMHFASQPSNLGLIQGPIVVSGGTSPFVPPLIDPIMLPYEWSEFNVSCVYIESLSFRIFTERVAFAVNQ